MKVIIIAAITADGFIGRDANHLADWTSKEDKQFFTETTKQAGVMIMGRSTYDTIGRALPGRKTIVYTNRPFETEDVEITTLPVEQLVTNLERAGYTEVAVCGGRAIYDMFLTAGVVDSVYLTIEPILFGAGVSLASSELSQRMKLTEVKKLNDDTILVKYEVPK